jgi:hypothetical protein
MISLPCSCGQKFRIPEEFRGRRKRCPDCSTIIVVLYNIEDIPAFNQLFPQQQAFNTQELIDDRLTAEFKARLYLEGGGQDFDSGKEQHLKH